MLLPSGRFTPGPAASKSDSPFSETSNMEQFVSTVKCEYLNQHSRSNGWLLSL